MNTTLPARFDDAEHLEDVMTAPTPALEADLARVPGDLLVLGVGGKMGPTLARMARRASPNRRVIGVARFTEPGLRAKLEALGVECVAADLLDRDALARIAHSAAGACAAIGAYEVRALAQALAQSGAGAGAGDATVDGPGTAAAAARLDAALVSTARALRAALPG